MRKKENKIRGAGGKKETEPAKKGKRGFTSFCIFNTRFDGIDQNLVKRHILLLIIASILMKFLVIFATVWVFHSFIDYFDLGFYFEHAVKITNGQIPYVNFQFDYPILIFVPILIALVPALITQNALTFVYSFQILMVICDIFILVSVYLIGLRFYNEKIAFYSGLIYATAFSTAYFVLTKYDAFPTCLLMGAILFTLYGMNIRGYIAIAAGFFSKIFPVLALPFMIFYNAKASSIRQEIFSALKIFVPFIILLLVPVAIINPDSLRTYLFATGSSVGVYVNTATYTIYACLADVLHLGISAAMVSTVMYIIMGVVLLTLLFIAFKQTRTEPKTLVKLILLTIFSIIFFSKFHSPQYIVWFSPLLCVLVADSIPKIILFYITQVLAYIEFPLMFGSFYVNLEYVNPIGSAGWYLTLLFFTIEYAVLLLLLYLSVKPQKNFFAIFKSYFRS